MHKTLKYFVFGGSLYFIIEVIFRFIVKHRNAHPIVIFIAGSVCALVFILDDKKINIILNSIIGGVLATILEFVIGFASLYLFNERLWQYSGITFMGIIGLKWSLLWIGLCFVCILTRRILKRLKRSK